MNKEGITQKVVNLGKEKISFGVAGIIIGIIIYIKTKLIFASLIPLAIGILLIICIVYGNKRKDKKHSRS
jgi:hypothetical protein